MTSKFNKIIRVLKDPSLLFLWLLRRYASCVKDDEYYVRMLYFLCMKKKLNLNQPSTFNEKLQWLKLYDQHDEYTDLVDKAKVKSYVAELIGEKYIIPTLGVWDHFEDIDFDLLPEQFVMKCTHDSGSTVVCKDKKNLNVVKVRKKINKALKCDIFVKTREYPYKMVKPKIIVEKYMNDKSQTDDLLDYKIMVFNGEVRCVFVCSNRNHPKGLCVDFYDLDWNHLPFQRHYRNNPLPIDKPSQMEKMISLSKQLASRLNAPFVRIDFYQIGEQPYFGEITFYPGNGMEEFTPEEWDYRLGEWLELPQK